MIWRRRFVQALVCAVPIGQVAGMGPIRRIGVLAPGTVANPLLYPEPLIQGLQELGWIEGQNLRVERRIAADRIERLDAMAGELLQLGVELIVTVGTPAALAAHRATKTVPIVMAIIGDPVSVGLVQSLARPGGNVTGNTLIEPDLTAKRLQMLRELFPSAKRIGELMNPGNPALEMLRAGEVEALRSLGLQPVFVDVKTGAELEGAIDYLKRQQADAILVHSDSLFISNRWQIMELALKHNLPTIAEGRTFVEAGALISYAPSSPVMIHNAARFIDKIFKGARPADLPVERPTKIELVINRKTARTLGIKIPDSILLRADDLLN